MLSKLVNLLRFLHTGYVMAREGVFSLVEVPDLPPGPRLALRLIRLIERKSTRRADAGARISVAFNRLGPSYVKMGQFLATRPDVVGREVAKELSLLQDRLEAFPRAEAIRMIEEAMGASIDDLFTEFGEPVAAASIAQVHPAFITDETGETHKMAVKVLRPGVARRFARDLKSFYLAARIIERFHAPLRRLRPLAVVDTLARSVELEMDLRLEAAALSEMAENTADDPGFRVPEVDWTRTTKGVLTLEWISGRKLSDVESIAEDGHDMVALGAAVIQSFLRHALRDGFFHADMHQGNLFVAENGDLVAVDFGITGRLDKAEKCFLAEILFGFITRDYMRVAEVHFEAGYVPKTQDVAVFSQAIRAIGEPIHGHNASEISMARLLTQLFEVTELFAMTTQPQLIMLQKTMVVVEGVARSLDPGLDMWKTAEPVVRTWIEHNLGPSGRIQDAGESISMLVRLAGELPTFAKRAERIVEGIDTLSTRGVKVESEMIDALSRSRRNRLGTAALWVIAVALVAIVFEGWW
ncbi:2-polyprenylphenol 6-hydroxylase [Breoghania sp.]|uniref:2-polyprenylphenol 6-hydroxylase n=1 Tax=Breoghania sp. TaxID=2065378 RepID=UPI0026270258|nr:2-polyprenylphenol 6-hydroxylase [Breoghania sp.]MDJ0930898.1 2-polyprenylphenol 6-hydroxylase [Breoghania sp.]